MTRRLTKKLLVLLLAASAMVAADPSIHVNDSGSLRDITGIFINDSGTLREIESVWINDSGVLRQVYANLSINLTGATLSTSDTSSPSTSTLVVQSDGTLDRNYNSSGNVQINSTTDWHIPNTDAPDDYEIRYTSISGDTGNFTSGMTVDVWAGVAGQFLRVTDTQNGPNAKSVTFTLEVRKGSGATIDTASYTLTADFDNL